MAVQRGVQGTNLKLYFTFYPTTTPLIGTLSFGEGRVRLFLRVAMLLALGKFTNHFF